MSRDRAEGMCDPKYLQNVVFARLVLPCRGGCRTRAKRTRATFGGGALVGESPNDCHLRTTD